VGDRDTRYFSYCYKRVEPVLYLDPVSKFPETTEKEKPGFFVGFADNVGDALTFKILKNNLNAVLHRSVVRSATDPTHRNKRVTFKPDTQEVLEKLDTIPGATIHRGATCLSSDQENLMMIFLIEIGPRQAILTRILVTEQGLRYSLSTTQVFKAMSFHCMMQ
jgi:hypothetical protein